MGRISSELTHWTSTGRHGCGGARRLQTRRTYSRHTFHRDPNFPEERPEDPSIPTWGPPSSSSSLGTIIFDLSFWAPLAPPLDILGKCGQNRPFTQKVAEYGWDSEVTCQFQRKGGAFFPFFCFNVLFQGSHVFLRLDYELWSIVIVTDYLPKCLHRSHTDNTILRTNTLKLRELVKNYLADFVR